MSFETLPVYQGSVPDMPHPVAAPTPPVYDNTHALKQLAILADYLSPESKAKRHAAIVKANYEARMYGFNGPLAFMKTRDEQRKDERLRAQIDHWNKMEDHHRSKGGKGAPTAAQIMETEPALPAQEASSGGGGLTTTMSNRPNPRQGSDIRDDDNDTDTTDDNDDDDTDTSDDENQ